MSYKLEQSIVPPPGTDTTVACDFEISESSSKLPAFFPRKTKCTPACCCGFTFELVKSPFPFAPLLARSVPSGVPFCKYCVPFHETFECVFLYKQSTIRSVQMEPNKFLKQKIGDHPSLLYNTVDIPRSMRTNTNTGVQGLWLWVSG